LPKHFSNIQSLGVSDPEGPLDHAVARMKHTNNSLCRELKELKCILDKLGREG